MIIKKPDKQSILYLLIVIAAAVLVCVGVYYISRTEIKEATFEKPETVTERQLRKLDELRGDTPPLSEEEVQEQLKELDKLHQESQ